MFAALRKKLVSANVTTTRHWNCFFLKFFEGSFILETLGIYYLTKGLKSGKTGKK